MTDSNSGVQEESFKSSIAQVRLAYNLADYMSQSGINLKQNGANKWKGLCFAHSEKTPSLIVNDLFQSYMCFGCGARGDLFSFVQFYEKLSFIEALRKLADDKNITIELTDSGNEIINRKSILKCLSASARFFYNNFVKLSEDHPAKVEITSRGLSIVDRMYGYASESRGSLLAHLRSLKFTDKIILQAGVCGKNKESGKLYDFWNGRLMFFIRDVSGNVVGFSGKKLFDSDSRGKYVNSPDGPIFSKSSLLFNLSNAKNSIASKKEVFVTEGQFDVMAMIGAGLDNVVASSGTAFTQAQAQICRRLVTNDGKIIFCFDGDSAGISAALKVFGDNPIIHQQAFVVVFPDNMDPCDYLKLHNGGKFEDNLEDFILKNQKPIIEFAINAAVKDIPLVSQLDKSRYVDAAVKILRKVSNLILREAYAKEVSLQSGVSLSVVLRTIEEAVTEDGTNKPNVVTEEVAIESQHAIIDATDEDKKCATSIGEVVYYEWAARWIACGLNSSSKIEAIHRNRHLIPSVMRRFVKELSLHMTDAKKSGKKLVIIPELFTDSLTAEKIITGEFFPLLHMMSDEDRLKHFIYIKEQIDARLNANKKSRGKKDVMKFLQESDQSAAFLEKALSME